MSQVIEKFQKDIKTIFWFAAGLFILLALASFNPQDPSFNSTGAGGKVYNLCGFVGSFLSDILYQLFGISAWFIAVAMIVKSYKVFKGEPRKQDKMKLLIPVFLLLTISSLIALYFPQNKIYSGSIYVSGVLGLGISKGLIAGFNSVGVSILLWSLFFVLSIFYTEKSIKDIGESIPFHLVLRRKWIEFKENIFAYVNSLFKAKLKIEKRASAEIIQDKTLAALKTVEPQKEIVEAAEGETKNSELFIQPTTTPKPKINAEALKKKRLIENWELPKLSILENPTDSGVKVDEKLIKRNTFILEDKLSQFSVNGQVVAVRPGPAVTMYEFKPNADVKISKITELADDLSLALSTESVRIIAPLPGRDVVGIETANPKREKVVLREILEDVEFWDDKTKLPIALGKEANGSPKTVDLRKMPHLLVAGTTGSGKSVFINSLITGLLFKHSPKTLKFIFVDPKQVDLATFHTIPHLVMPPIKDPKRAVNALKWTVREMDKRYRSMSRLNVRGIEAFNERVAQFTKEESSQHQAFNDELETQNRHSTESYYFTEQPYIVVVVEEFGDLMAVDKANVEQLIVRLAQMARACGIHLVLAMQSPRRDVVTGLIKTNIPGRVSFKVASKMDSRIILDESGAERLLAQGDMLFLAPGVSKPQRHHGAWVSEDEMNQVVGFWSKQSDPEYDPVALKIVDGSPGAEGGDALAAGAFEEGDTDGADERYDEMLAYVSTLKEVSASLLQRRFRLGYPRAARLIEIMEQQGVVGPSNGSKPRQVLVSKL